MPRSICPGGHFAAGTTMPKTTVREMANSTGRRLTLVTVQGGRRPYLLLHCIEDMPVLHVGTNTTHCRTYPTLP